MRVGIPCLFPSLAVQSGPAIHTKFLYEGLLKRGHEPMLMGPDTGDVAPVEMNAQVFPSFAYPTHPSVKVAMPGNPLKLFREAPHLDVLHGQDNTHMVHYPLWLRQYRQIPFINTHIIHLPTHSHFLLSDKLYKNDVVREWWMGQALNMEKSFAETIYNRSDGFVVQSRHFVDYWRERGVKTPIYVVGRPINPDTWSRQPQGDPFPAHFKVGKRLVCVCRHDREKNLRRLIKIFCNNIAPYDDEATLTLVGDGHDHKNLAQACMATPYADRIHLPGESTHEQLVDWYAHADVFVYTSLSETFGNVVNEALWCGLPVVALDDGMGVAGQVVHDVNGALIPPHVIDADGRFGAACLQILGDRQQRRAMGSEAANLSRATSHPDVVLSRFEGIYREAREHCRRTVPVPLERQGKVASWKAFAKAYATWAFWNGTLLTVAHTATRLGASRTGGAVQHGEVEQLVRDLEQRIEREQRTAA